MGRNTGRFWKQIVVYLIFFAIFVSISSCIGEQELERVELKIEMIHGSRVYLSDSQANKYVVEYSYWLFSIDFDELKRAMKYNPTIILNKLGGELYPV